MIREAAKIIRSGGVIIYPTETVYGLGANALDEQAIYRVFEIKRRPPIMPISLAISSMNMLHEVAELDRNDIFLLEKLLPGPISVLVRKKCIVPDRLTAGSPLVSIRFPEHEMAMKIIDLSGPITSTSANITGYTPPASVEEISLRIKEKVDLVLDGKKSKYAQPSTLVDIPNRKIIREGAGLDRAIKAIF
jgi:L-threonylcarbamoyladenylate synthase